MDHERTIELVAIRSNETSKPKRTSERPNNDFHDSSPSQSNVVQPSPFAFFSLMVGISLAAFLVALDRTIVANAIPKITDQFNSPGDAGWYGSAYLLTACAFQPTYGRVFAHFDVRWSFITALSLFETGSLICGVAPNSTVLIVGRAIAGIGCAGVFAGCLVIVAMTTPLASRPAYMGAIGSIFGIGAVCGPLLGGVLTSEATWRWCFFINLPIGAVTTILLLLFFHPARTGKDQEGTFTHRLLRLDLVGNFILIVTVVMLLLVLQWGGLKYAWGSARVIGLLVAAGIGFLIFVLWQYKKGVDALIPLWIVVQRGVAASIGVMFFLGGALLVHTYYLPYWFQAVRGRTAVQSGVDLVPYVATNFVFTMIAGIAVNKTGYFKVPAVLGPVIACVGCGLLTTLRPDTNTATWAGFEVLTAAGMGIAMQQPVIAVQAILEPSAVPIANAVVLFAQSLSGAIFISVANNVLRNELAQNLKASGIPDVGRILAAGATNVQELVPAEFRAPLLAAYNHALSMVFSISIPFCGLALLFAFGMPWINLKKKQVQRDTAEA